MLECDYGKIKLHNDLLLVVYGDVCYGPGIKVVMAELKETWYC